jgi:hypothetical protein
MADVTLKQNDTWPPLAFTLMDQNGPVDLTTATSIKIVMKGATVTVTGTCTKNADQVTNKGKGTYTFLASDTSVIGAYDLEFEVNWGGSPAKIQTFPNDGYLSLVIVDDLG